MKAVTLVTALGIGPVAMVDERHVFYVALGAPDERALPGDLQQSQVSTVVSTSGNAVVVLGHYDEIAGQLMPGEVPADARS